jgi:transposase
LHPTKLLAFLPAALALQRVDTAADRVTVSARVRAAEAACPLCGACSRRVHSRYRRCLRDLPWQGRQVRLELQVRRFRCADAKCSRRVFAERLPDVAAPRRQRTQRLAELQRCVGLATGGAKGARLAARLAMPVSGDTLRRLIRATPIERGPPPKVIGIDDWASASTTGRRHRRLGVAPRPALGHHRRRPRAEPAHRPAARPRGRDRRRLAPRPFRRDGRRP